MKFKRYTGLVLSLLMIALILLLFVFPRGSERSKGRQILIGDSSRIDQVMIVGGSDTVRLFRADDVWKLPGGEDVNPVAVENLLFAAERLQVDAVHNDQHEWSDRASREVIFMKGERPVLQYALLSREGCMLLRPEGSEKIFTVSLPGYPELDLNRVFSDLENHYREHMLIDLLPSEIRLIELEKKGQPAFRFSMDRAGGLSCELPNSDSLIPMDLLDEGAVRMLFTYFTSIRYEELAGERQPVSDLASLYVESHEGEKHSLQVYSLPGESGEKEDMFRALVIHNNDPDPLVINYIYLDVLMRGLSAYIGDNL
jgi:hypothetical protein